MKGFECYFMKSFSWSDIYFNETFHCFDSEVHGLEHISFSFSNVLVILYYHDFVFFLSSEVISVWLLTELVAHIFFFVFHIEILSMEFLGREAVESCQSMKVQIVPWANIFTNMFTLCILLTLVNAL